MKKLTLEMELLLDEKLKLLGKDKVVKTIQNKLEYIIYLNEKYGGKIIQSKIDLTYEMMDYCSR